MSSERAASSSSPAAPEPSAPDCAPSRSASPLSSKTRHDLRTHLNQILGYSELLLDEVEDRVDWAADLKKIHAAGSQLLALINSEVDPISSRAANAPSAPTAAPKAEAVSIVSPDTEDSAEETKATQGTLLVVEDDALNRDLLTRRLRQEGFTVRAVESGEQALARLRAESFDLILLDVMMPQMDGYEALTRIKTDETLRHLPVVMISALDELDSAVRCIALGAEDYLPKPFDPVLLKARIGASLEKKRLRDQEVRLFQQLQTNYTRLQELETLRDDLTHMIVHDLRTPLTSLLTGLQTLELLGVDSEDQQEILTMSLQGGQTLLGMINDLLDIGKMEGGSMALAREPVEASVIIAQAVAQIASLAAQKRLTLLQNIAPGVPAVYADEEKLRRILVNLLGNAIKFTPEDGTVTISAESQGECVAFAVRDTGEGIPAEAFGRIFEKFGQVETRKAGRKMSSGLGLTFCKMAVEMHGGQITVESEPGQGSVFRFTIPRAPA